MPIAEIESGAAAAPERCQHVLSCPGLLDRLAIGGMLLAPFRHLQRDQADLVR